MTLLVNPADGAASGTTVSTANSAGTGNAFDVVNIGAGSTLIFDSAQAAHGTLSYKLATDATAHNVNAQWTTSLGSGLATAWFRFYAYFTANPAVNTPVCFLRSGTALASQISVTITGKIAMSANPATTTILNSANTIPLNAWFRVEGFVTGSATAGQAEFKLFATSMDAASPDETQTSAATLNTTGLLSRIDFGNSGAAIATMGPYWLDDLGASTTGYVGAAATPAVTAPAIAASGAAAAADGTAATLTPVSVRSSAAYASAVTETSSIITMPAGWQPGDVVYIGWALAAATGTLTTPAGWTRLLIPVANPVTASGHHSVLRRVMAAGDPSSVTIAHTSGRLAAIAVAVANADNGTPEDGVPPAADVNSGTAYGSINAPSVTPVSTDDLLLTFHAAYDSANGSSLTSFTYPAAMTGINSTGTAVASVSEALIGAAYLTLSSNAPTAAQTAVAAVSAVPPVWAPMGSAVAVASAAGGPFAAAATAAAAAQDAVIVTSAPAAPAAGLPAGTGAGLDAGADLTGGGAPQAAAAAAGLDATVSTIPVTSPPAAPAAGTGAAALPRAAPSVTVPAPAGTGAGQQATVTTSTSAAAAAALAAGTAAAQQPTAAAGANAALAAAAGLAQQPGHATAANTATAAGTGLAQQPAAAAASAASAAGSAAAQQPAAAVTATASTAHGTGTAANVTVSTSSAASTTAGQAPGTGLAQQPAPAGAANTGLPAGSAAASPALAAASAAAGPVTATAAAQPSAVQRGITPAAALAAGTGTSQPPAPAATVTTTATATATAAVAATVTAPAAAVAAGTGTSQPPQPASATGTASAAAAALAQQPGHAIAANAAPAAGTGAGQQASAQSGGTAPAVLAAGTGTADPATTTLSALARATAAQALAAALFAIAEPETVCFLTAADAPGGVLTAQTRP